MIHQFIYASLQAAIAENGTQPLILWEQAKTGLEID
jgi:hypothetical protein